jgi:hypothetical protein
MWLQLRLGYIKDQNLLSFLSLARIAQVVVNVHQTDDLAIETTDLLQPFVYPSR